MRNRLLVVMVGTMSALSAGCRPPDEGLQPVAKKAPSPAEAAYRRILLGSSVEGRPIECLEFGQGEEVVLIMASIHGSEPAGTPLVRQLADYLAHRPGLLQGRRVLLMPVANPDGLARGARHNVHGVDLNRNFPASNYRSSGSGGSTALSEPESMAIYGVLRNYRPDRIVSIHQPMNHGSACLDYDGPAEMLAQAMAARSDLPVHKLGARDGSLGSYAGVALGIPIITVELPKEASDLEGERLWARYGGMLLAAIRFPEPVVADGTAAAK